MLLQMPCTGSFAIAKPASLKVVIEPSERALWNSGDEFHDGLLSIGFHGKYVGRTGRTVINRRCNSAWDFSDGLAAVQVDGGNMRGFIDTKGEFAIPPKFAGHRKGYVSSFSEGRTAIETNGAVGYVDETGTFVISQQFMDGAPFREGIGRGILEGACFYFPDGPCGAFNHRIRPASANGKGDSPACKFTFMDRTGKPLAMRFEGAKHFAGGSHRPSLETSGDTSTRQADGSSSPNMPRLNRSRKDSRALANSRRTNTSISRAHSRLLRSMRVPRTSMVASQW
jgi:hypothetical protein